MKSIFQRAPVTSAVAAALAAGLAANSAQAVNITDTGLGEVAMIPYYTVRNQTDTYISMVNTDPDEVVAVKLRFRERDNTRDARDFNIFLSPNDVWTAVVTMNADGFPVVQTGDTSCTAPALIETQATMPGMRGVAFTNAGYNGVTFPEDGGSTGIERTYDGHVEIIMMGMADPAVSPIAAAAVHVQNGVPGQGVPADCAYILGQYASNAGNAPFKAQFTEPDNVLKVAANLITVDRGVAAMIPVDHLANFFNPDDPTDDLMQNPEDQNPSLRDVDPPVSAQIANGNTAAFPDLGAMAGVIVDEFSASSELADTVSSLFMATGVANEYAIGGAANALYDWVLTFPTKNFYVDNTLEQPGAPIPPFKEAFAPNGRSCETVTYNYFDREELYTSNPGQVDFSPKPPDAPSNAICQETNVLFFNPAESVLTGTDFTGNVYGVDLASGYTSGWMRLDFAAATDKTYQYIDGASYRYYGLPVTGFGIKTYSNGVAAAQSLDYGLTQAHAYIREYGTP